MQLVVPGSEFRASFKAARQIGTMVYLADRPISITLKRTWNALSLWEKCSLAFHILWSDLKVTPEDVEKLKNADLITEMMEEVSDVLALFLISTWHASLQRLFQVLSKLL